VIKGDSKENMSFMFTIQVPRLLENKAR